MADRKVIELVIDEEQENFAVDALSLVKFPAIESDFIFLRKDNRYLSFAQVDEEQRTLIGPALIPNKNIPRYDEATKEEYEVYFSEETVKRAAELFLEQKNTDSHTFEHGSAVDQVHVVESWLVHDENMDKSKSYGLSVPKGTWMVRVKVDNDEVWESVKAGEVRGFSIEGYFVDKVVEMNRQKTADTIDLEDPCWDGYEMVGMKEKDGRMVPNCVPIEASKMSIAERVYKAVMKVVKPRKFYAEVKLTTGAVLATEDETMSAGSQVFTLDDEGMPVEIGNGSYTTEGGVNLVVFDNVLTEYDGEVQAVEDASAEKSEAEPTDLKSEMLTLYYKKLLDMKKQNMSAQRREFGYNGWTNYETWLVGVWEFTNYFFDTAMEQEMSEVSAEWCRDMFDEMVESDMPRNNGIISDMVNASISEIDWRDIAEHVNFDLEQERG